MLSECYLHWNCYWYLFRVDVSIADGDDIGLGIGERDSMDIATNYNNIIMGAIASQITSITIVYSIVYPDADQRKHQSSASLAFVRGIHRGPVNSQHKWSVTRKIVLFDDVIMWNWYRQVHEVSLYFEQTWHKLPATIMESTLLTKLLFPFRIIIHSHIQLTASVLELAYLYCRWL